MIFFVHGEDDFLVNKHRSFLQQSFLKDFPEGDLFVFDFEDRGMKEEVEKSIALCDVGLFTSKKMIIFIHPFLLAEKEEELFLHFLQEFVSQKQKDVTLLFVEPGKIKKTNALVKFLLKHRDVEEYFSRLDIKNTGEYIKKRLNTLDPQASFSREAWPIFIKFLGNNTARIETELQKLIAYKPGGVFEKEDIFLLVGSVAEDVIFDALNFLIQGKKEKALLLFRKETAKTEGVYKVLSLCAWQVRNLLIVKELFDQKLTAPDIATRAKINFFVVQKMIPVLRSLSMIRIKRGLALLSESDTSIKQGTLDPLVALDMFVWKF